jgi:hypothetical protein
MSFPVAARPKASVCGCSLAGFVGSNPPRGGGAWMSVCCVLSGKGLCDELITRPEESDRVWCVCHHESSIMRRPWPAGGLLHHGKKKFLFNDAVATAGYRINLFLLSLA